MTTLRRKLALIAAAAIAVTVGLLTFGPVSADDPVVVKLNPWTEGANSVVDVAITNNTKDNLGLDIKALLPASATYVGANPQRGSEFTGGYVHWVASVAPGKTAVGYQYKFKGAGTATVTVSYIGSTRGIVTASAAATAPAAGLAQVVVAATIPPVAVLEIVPVPANAADANAIKATLPGTTSTVAMGTTGLPNVSVGVPVALQAKGADATSPAKTFVWTLSKPTASKATLDKTDAALVKFTPDMVGTYKVDVVVRNEAGASPMASVQIRAGTYIGVTAGNCKNCHAAAVTEWSETGHAEIFNQQINGGADPATSHYGEGCLRCHTTGYYIGANNGGFADVQAKIGWKFPELSVIQTGKALDTVPAALKNMANIQCEDCHGPAKEHVNNSAPMAASLDEGVCNVCHNGGGSHIKGTQTQYAKHGDETSRAWTYPTGPSRQACVRCHSGAGYISFTKNPTEMAAWDSTAQTLTCASCHDPHSDANPFQLRIVGKPVEVTGVTKDFGLSATCTECHWARNTGADAAKSAATPHYSTATEMMANVGGVDYGKTLANSPHGAMVGAAPMKNAAGADLYGGNTPGPCVACHMYPTPTDKTDPNINKVGAHSWNVVSPDGLTDYTAACQSCHGNVKDFKFQSRADYDGNGKTETVQSEVAGLLKVLGAAIESSGIKQVVGHPYFDAANKANWTTSQKNAIYNFLFVRGLEGTDGKAAAVHNFKRAVSLLQASYKDLAGKDVPNATLVK